MLSINPEDFAIAEGDECKLHLSNYHLNNRRVHTLLQFSNRRVTQCRECKSKTTGVFIAPFTSTPG